METFTVTEEDINQMIGGITASILMTILVTTHMDNKDKKEEMFEATRKTMLEGYIEKFRKKTKVTQ